MLGTLPDSHERPPGKQACYNRRGTLRIVVDRRVVQNSVVAGSDERHPWQVLDLCGLLNRLQIVSVHFDRYAAHNHFESENEAELVLFSHSKSLPHQPSIQS